MSSFTSDQILALLYSRAIENGNAIDRSVCACVMDLVNALEVEYSLDGVDASKLQQDLEAMLNLTECICSISPSAWRCIYKSSEEIVPLAEWQRRLAFGVGAAIEKGQIVSFKQAVHGKVILDAIEGVGFDKLEHPAADELKEKAKCFGAWNASQRLFQRARRNSVAKLIDYTRQFAADETKPSQLFWAKHLAATALGRALEWQVPDPESVLMDLTKLTRCLQSIHLVASIDLDDLAKQIASILNDIKWVSTIPSSQWRSIAECLGKIKHVSKVKVKKAQRIGRNVERNRRATPYEAKTAVAIYKEAMKLGCVGGQPSHPGLSDSFSPSDTSGKGGKEIETHKPQKERLSLAAEEQEVVDRVSQFPPSYWFRVQEWGVETGNLEEERCQKVHAIGLDIASGNVLTHQQAREGEEILKTARSRGFES